MSGRVRTVWQRIEQQADEAQMRQENERLRQENERLRAEVERLREALTQSNRYIDEAVKKRMLRYDEAVAKYGVRSPEVREQSKLLHDLINGTRASFDSAHRALAALAGSREGSPQTPRKLDAPVEYVPSLQRMTDDVRRREMLDLTGEPTPEVLDRLSEVQSYVRCGEPSARDRALAERVRLHVAEQFFLVMERGDVSLSDAFDKMRALDLDALLEEP